MFRLVPTTVRIHVFAIPDTILRTVKAAQKRPRWHATGTWADSILILRQPIPQECSSDSIQGAFSWGIFLVRSIRGVGYWKGFELEDVRPPFRLGNFFRRILFFRRFHFFIRRICIFRRIIRLKKAVPDGPRFFRRIINLKIKYV